MHMASPPLALSVALSGGQISVTSPKLAMSAASPLDLSAALSGGRLDSSWFLLVPCVRIPHAFVHTEIAPH